MKQNIKVAKELIKLAKSLVAGQNYTGYVEEETPYGIWLVDDEDYGYKYDNGHVDEYTVNNLKEITIKELEEHFGEPFESFEDALYNADKNFVQEVKKLGFNAFSYSQGGVDHTFFIK